MNVICGICEKGFENVRQLNGHKSVHREGGRYSKPRKSSKYCKTFECLNCEVEFEFKHQTENKFCSNKCSSEYRWENEFRVKIENGLAGPDAVKRYLKKVKGEFCAECGQGNMHNGKTLVLQLDHIDGNSDNNKLNNVRLLCPNCHTQTETFSRSGPDKPRTRRSKEMKQYRMVP